MENSKFWIQVQYKIYFYCYCYYILFLKNWLNGFIFILENSMTTERLVERIIMHRLEYETRNINKEKKELAIYEAYKKSKNERSG